MALIRDWLFGGNENKIEVGYTPGFIEKQMAMLTTNTYSNKDAGNISTVYTCIKILSETIARLPLNIYKTDSNQNKYIDKTDPRYVILHYNPNNYTTAYNFYAAIERFKNTKGNGFALIHRTNGRLDSLEIIPPSRVKTYKVVNNTLFYKIYKLEKDDSYSEKTFTIQSNDILHFKSLTNDGILGINPIEALRYNLSTTSKALQTLDNIYENQGFSNRTLQSTLSGVNQEKVLSAAENFRKKFDGYNFSGKTIVVPPGMELKDITLNLLDAQFIETIKFNANQISSLFGVPPHLVGNMESSKFNNVEQLQLNFKVNTISAIARMYRQELEMKLLTPQERLNGVSIEFVTQALVETDLKTRVDSYDKLSNHGMTDNFIARLEGYDTYPEGDLHYKSTQVVPVELNIEKQRLEIEKQKGINKINEPDDK